MDGIEAIIEHILSDAREKAAQIEAAASEQVNQITIETDGVCAQIQQEAEQKSQQAADAVLNRASSQASLESRRALLETRQFLIDEVITQATRQLGDLSAAEKEDLYTRMIQATGLKRGALIANEADQSVMKAVAKTLGSDWTLADKIGDFSGGFILSQGRIEENLTFDLLVRNLRPQLAALAAGILFPEAG